jgi:hypothetical protein
MPFLPILARRAVTATSPETEGMKMKTFRVEIKRAVTQTHDLEIEAENEDEAREKADDEMHYIDDSEWDDGIDADLEIGEVTELTGVMEEEETADG